MTALPGIDTAADFPALVRQSASLLAAAGCRDPEIKAAWLLEHLTGLSRFDWPLHPERRLPPAGQQAFKAGLERLLQGHPVQYVVGQTNFMGLAIRCDPRALIPRPETECLVEALLETSWIWRHPRPKVADVGTGTGCILLTLASRHPEGKYIGIDRSREALNLALENEQQLQPGGAVSWRQGDLLEPLADQRMHAIAANLPYIPLEAWRGLDEEVRIYEPRLALEAGADGLDLIRRLVQSAPDHLHPGGYLFLESGEDQVEPIVQLMEQAGFSNLDIINDLAGRPRITAGRLA